ncbi:hypothetical protein ACJX0J_006072, partial [Zea mays]
HIHQRIVNIIDTPARNRTVMMLSLQEIPTQSDNLNTAQAEYPDGSILFDVVGVPHVGRTKARPRRACVIDGICDFFIIIRASDIGTYIVNNIEQSHKDHKNNCEEEGNKTNEIIFFSNEWYSGGAFKIQKYGSHFFSLILFRHKQKRMGHKIKKKWE